MEIVKNHGGKRPGSGAKKKPYKTKVLQIKVRECLYEELKKSTYLKRSELEQNIQGG